MSEIHIEITIRKPMDCIDADLLRQGVERVLTSEGIEQADVSLAIVDDREIHRVNREFLGHDYPTDVISFLLSSPDRETLEADDSAAALSTPTESPEKEEQSGSEGEEQQLDQIFSAGRLQGELIVSVDTAIREAHVHGWSPRAELLLYVVHGMLHLCGYDDLTDDARPLMRLKEREILATWGFCPTGLE